MKVYIVTSGIYSDYQIEAVFSTEEKAKAYIDIYGNYDNRQIEIYDMDIESIEREEASYTVVFDSNGCSVYRNSNSSEKDTIRTYKQFVNNCSYILTVEADCCERAKKIASERLTQVKAMPYLFPRLYEECVGKNMRYSIDATHDAWRPFWHYPTYNFHTKEIILEDGEFLKDESI